MKKFIISGVVLLILIFLLGYSLGWVPEESSDNSATQTTYRVTPRDISKTIIATGIIKPKVGAEVRVGSRLSGVLKKLYVNIGDAVEQGQLIALLDSSELESRLNLAEKTLENNLIELKFARSDFDRAQKLYQQKLISAEVADDADKQVLLAESRVKQAEASLETARIQLSFSRIYSPINGVVASISTKEGETVAASFASPTFVTIINPQQIEMWAYVDETDIGYIEKNQEVSFTVDTYPEAEFDGVVHTIYPKAEILDNVVNYVTIVNIVDQKDKILRPEMTTTVRIFLANRSQVLAVPNRTIKRENGRNYVYVEGENGAVKTFVTVGIRDNYFTEILDGLKGSESLIVDSSLTLPD